MEHTVPFSFFVSIRDEEKGLIPAETQSRREQKKKISRRGADCIFEEVATLFNFSKSFCGISSGLDVFFLKEALATAFASDGRERDIQHRPTTQMAALPARNPSNLTKTDNNEKKQPAYFGDLSFSLCPCLCTRKTEIFTGQF